MDATRVGRKPRPDRSPASARAEAPTEEVPLLAGPVPPLPMPLERLALVAWVLGRERAAELLCGLEAGAAASASEHLRRLASLPSAQRQAKVSVEFGERPDAAARLRQLMSEASPLLRGELLRRLPPYHRTLFPSEPRGAPRQDVPHALSLLAERLIREATR